MSKKRTKLVKLRKELETLREKVSDYERRRAQPPPARKRS
jgi:hypothetical protein